VPPEWGGPITPTIGEFRTVGEDAERLVDMPSWSKTVCVNVTRNVTHPAESLAQIQSYLNFKIGRPM
jgi:hypothetical protein